MVFKCHICGKYFVRRWNLDRHLECLHPQKGGGFGTAAEDEEKADAEEEHSAGPESIDSSEEDSGDETDDDDDDAELEKQHDNSVFDRFMLPFDPDETLTESRKSFRKKVADFLVYMSHLKKNPIYKKIMISAREFQGNGHDFSRAEAIRSAVKLRKYLLDELIEESMDDESSDVDDVGDDLDTSNY